MKNTIEILRNKYSENEPISIQDIRLALPEYTRGRIYQIIDELEERDQLKRFDQGIYYIPKKTIFGDSVLDPRKIINKKYITDGENNYGCLPCKRLSYRHSFVECIWHIYSICKYR